MLSGYEYVAERLGPAGAPRHAAREMPVSYTHLDVYKRQVRMRLVYLGNGNVNIETVVEFFFYVTWLEDDTDLSLIHI